MLLAFDVSPMPFMPQYHPFHVGLMPAFPSGPWRKHLALQVNTIKILVSTWLLKLHCGKVKCSLCRG